MGEPSSLPSLDFTDFFPVWERYKKRCDLEACKKDSLCEGEVFSFQMRRPTKYRYFELTVHTYAGQYSLRCESGATCQDLLDLLETEYGPFVVPINDAILWRL